MRLQYILVYLILFSFACTNPGDQKLVGDWGIIEFRIYQRGNNSASSEKMLRNAGAIWDLNFTGSGKFRQDYNMSDKDMTTKTQSGSWKTIGDSLKIKLDFDSISMVMNYTYKIDNNILTLDLQHPVSRDKVISRFRKK